MTSNDQSRDEVLNVSYLIVDIDSGHSAYKFETLAELSAWMKENVQGYNSEMLDELFENGILSFEDCSIELVTARAALSTRPAADVGTVPISLNVANCQEQATKFALLAARALNDGNEELNLTYEGLCSAFQLAGLYIAQATRPAAVDVEGLVDNIAKRFKTNPFDTSPYSDDTEFVTGLIRKALAAQHGDGVPDGYVLVPIEPTKDMLNNVGFEGAKLVWSKMLAAAPQPAKGEA